MRKLTAVLFTALLLPSMVIPVKSQQSTADEMRKKLEMMNTLSREIDKRLKSAREKGNKLTELETLRLLDAEYSAQGPDAQEVVATRLMEMTIELSNYAEALRYADVGGTKPAPAKPSLLSELETYKPVDAFEAISKVSNTAQIILINEAHHVPQHRAFTLELLKTLRQKGFTHFAAETLFESDTRLQERKYPTKDTGAYINEPLYGDLVRTALKLEYRVVPYEWRGQYSPDNRERGQAANLVERIFKDNPKAKLVVHAGYSHINETGTLAGAKTMAQRVKEMTGIDPFTIDQTMMTEHSAPEFEHPVYRYLIEKKRVTKPCVLRNIKGEMWALEQGKWDVTLVHPRSIYKAGRPIWLRLSGNRKPYQLPANICDSATRCLVRARVAGESFDAIPIDQVEVVTGRNIPALMLPAGEFTLEIEDATGKRQKTFQIKLK
jgi:hypothetical protein